MSNISADLLPALPHLLLQRVPVMEGGALLQWPRHLGRIPAERAARGLGVLADGVVGIVNALILILFKEIFLLLVNKQLGVKGSFKPHLNIRTNLLLEKLCCMKSLATLQA